MPGIFGKYGPPVASKILIPLHLMLPEQFLAGLQMK
jgi:hypothetical protein